MQPEQQGPKVRAAGRIVLRRKKGKLIFTDIRDWTGQIQLFIGMNQVGEENWELCQCLDLGDIIGVDGELRKTKTGELTIFAEKIHFLTKSLETPPAKHKGLTDPELRYRMRYLDLIHTEGVLERALRRTKIVQSVRNTLSTEGFVEVEGPTLARDSGWGGRATVYHAPQRVGYRPLHADRVGATPENGLWSAESSECTNWAASTETKGSTQATTPSSPCSKCTRPTATIIR